MWRKKKRSVEIQKYVAFNKVKHTMSGTHPQITNHASSRKIWARMRRNINQRH